MTLHDEELVRMDGIPAMLSLRTARVPGIVAEPARTTIALRWGRLCFDGRTLEHRFALSFYARIPTAYPDAVIEYVQGADAPETAWPYLLPRPGDAWAGARDYRARWTEPLPEQPAGDLDLALWLVDTTRLVGTLRVSVGGQYLADVDLPRGGSREGDATFPGSTLQRSYHELPVPAALLSAGEAVIELHRAEGVWVAWVAVGLFARGS